jgi:hypothetical protein
MYTIILRWQLFDLFQSIINVTFLSFTNYYIDYTAHVKKMDDDFY